MNSDNLQQNLLDYISTAVVVLDDDLRVLFINASAQVLLECSEARTLGATIDQLLPGQPGLREDLLNAQARFNAYTNRDVSLFTAGGHELHVDLTVTPLQETTAGARQLILEFQPVDRILRISREEQLLSTAQHTQALLRGLAHEIKNPLGGLRGAAQLLALELPDPELREYTNIIVQEADRLHSLVDRLFGNNQLPNKSSLNIHAVIEHVANLLAAESGASLELRRDYDPSVPEIYGDRSQLIQAVLNIALNAVQATRDNTGSRIIGLRTRVQRQFTIGSQRHRLCCRLDITDNGAGIPRELEHALFVPMVSGRPDGSGLGLSISQSIINHHDGLIEASSEPGCTRFTIYLPLDTENAKTQ
jgi:two-component system nitrogen regulation sensor histidine kinase GlnL